MKLAIISLPILVFCVGTLAQGPDTEQEIPFQNKDKEACVMQTSGQGEIRLKIECKSGDDTYSCEFTGKPSYCRAYNKDRSAFWNQLSQDLKKMSKPCSAPLIKNSLCPRAPSQSQFKPADPSQPSDTKKPAPTKSKEEDEENPKAMKVAKEHCSWFFQKFCSYMVEIFMN
ncbi:fibroblast growth factor-binding protein 2 [Spea bombifrons]|uniref:fibroblast growth factor-binding protein 2 n=1 Tax=Spea bombifrons TaxID=233779 RepID=UPI00234B3890|nr:fibroblast growth factor-binding protein 2 [Spea bombifrons]